MQNIINKLAAGEKLVGHSGAEQEGMHILQLLLSEFIIGEGDLAIRMRRFVYFLQQKEDYLRQNVITHEQWNMLWPIVNQLTSARSSYVEQREQIKAELAGAGVFRPDSATENRGGNQIGSSQDFEQGKD